MDLVTDDISAEATVSRLEWLLTTPPLKVVTMEGGGIPKEPISVSIDDVVLIPRNEIANIIRLLRQSKDQQLERAD